MGRMVIAAYRPKPGGEDALLELTREHVGVLRAEGLVTERPAYAMRAADGTIVEVFEWKSPEAIAAAHQNPQVLSMWGRYAQACEYVPLTSLKEAHEMFAEFEPIAL
jgi:Antibiotic biosynthesis monooxygenase